MNPQQILALLALIADMRLTIEELSATLAKANERIAAYEQPTTKEPQ